jgi:hypothetical protein
MQSEMTPERRGEDSLMSSLAKRTAAIIDAAMTSVDANRFLICACLCSYTIARFMSPI